MRLKFKNYDLPSSPIWKKIGDICLFTIPVYIPILLSLPLKDVQKMWIVGVLNMLLATIKIITKFTVDENYTGAINVNDDQQHQVNIITS
jgi:hypothetical protein